MSIFNPENMLALAQELVFDDKIERDQESLRRAISSAYYAVFHVVLTEIADIFLGRDARGTSRYSLAYRSVDHRRIKQLCDDMDMAKLPEKYQKYLPPEGFGPELSAFGPQVVLLQEKRNAADYDPQFHATGSDATLAIDLARAAIANFLSVDLERRRAFASLILFTPK